VFHGQEEVGSGMVKSAKRRITWAFAFGACPTAHALELTHSVLTGGKTLSLDGRLVAEQEGSVAATVGDKAWVWEYGFGPHALRLRVSRGELHAVVERRQAAVQVPRSVWHSLCRALSRCQSAKNSETLTLWHSATTLVL
jgi:hypothetical protein